MSAPTSAATMPAAGSQIQMGNPKPHVDLPTSPPRTAAVYAPMPTKKA